MSAPDMLIHKMNGHPIWWKDDAGTTHLCRGRQSPGLRQFWTLCDQDVPRNALFGADKGNVACAVCASKAAA